MIRKIGLFVLALVLVAAAWELYKAIGPEDGGKLFGMRILPRANDIAMPHVWEMGERLAENESRTWPHRAAAAGASTEWSQESKAGNQRELRA